MNGKILKGKGKKVRLRGASNLTQSQGEIGNPLPMGGRRSSLALYEASCAVVNQLFIGDLTKVWINDKGNGNIEVPDRERNQSTECANELTVIYAGIYVKDNWIESGSLICETPDNRRMELLQLIGGFTNEDIIDLEKRVSEIVQEYEETIKHVANILKRIGRLRGEQINQMLAKQAA